VPLPKTFHRQAPFALNKNLGKIWKDHMNYARNYMISALSHLGDANLGAESLPGNLDNLKEAVRPYFGEKAGRELEALVREHILVTAAFVHAAKLGKHGNPTAAKKQWNTNADKLAALLSGIHPSWQKETLVESLEKHLLFTSQEIVSRHHRDWDAAEQAREKGVAQMHTLADMVTSGIIRDFLSKNGSPSNA
jgi:hypothetical protein